MVRLLALKNIRHSCGSIYAGQCFDTQESTAKRYIDGGIAIPEDGQWHGLDWKDSEVVILASGPSLSLLDVEAVERWRNYGTGRRVIAVNSTFRMAPWADVLYAGDKRWWLVYKDLLDAFEGERWSGAIGAQLYGAKYIHNELGEGLGVHPGVIRLGRNSGYQAINLAYQAGAKKIILLGFDCRDVDGLNHWHGDHPPLLRMRLDYPEWIRAFGVLAGDLKKTGVEVVNCTPDSALTCFPCLPLMEVLGVEDAAAADDVADDGVSGANSDDHVASGGVGLHEEVGAGGNGLSGSETIAVRPMGADVDVGGEHDPSGSGVSEGRISGGAAESRVSDRWVADAPAG